MQMKHLKKESPRFCFWFKLFLLFVPFLPLVIIYFYYDPDMILHKYKRFDETKVFLKEAHVGWQNYIQNRDSIDYNSFIMGNSCTMAFKTQAWEKYLNDKSKAVRFFDNAETIGGVFQKMQVLDSVGAKLDNVLVVIDRNSLIDTNPLNSTNHLFSPEVAGISRMEFNLRFLQEFLYPSRALAYAEYVITGKYSSRMSGVIHNGDAIREPYTNNFINPREQEISKKGESYWADHKREFRKKRINAGKEEKAVVFNAQLDLLNRMNVLCKKHNTNIKIIVGPDYYQKRINQADITKMKEIFGDEAVWDFTGINKYTVDIHNYYDPGHYRPFIGEQLLEIIYH